MSTPMVNPLAMMMLCSIFILNSKQWVVVWVVLEMSTIGFIMFMSTEEKKEKTITFFIFQTIPSILMMVTIFNLSWSWEQANEMTLMLIMMSIFIKIGVFPFNTWMMKFNSKISWQSLTIILTWQKIIPIIILLKWSSKISMILYVSSCLLMMSVILLKTTDMKILISVSSISHNLWLMVPMFMVKLYSTAYIFFYSLMVAIINIQFMKSNIKTMMNQTFKKKYFKDMVLKMCSLAGVPPTMGFILKMMVMFSVIWMCSLSMNLVFFLILASSISFYVYSQMMIKNTLLHKMNMNKSMKKMSKKMTFLFASSLSSAFLMFI